MVHVNNNYFKKAKAIWAENRETEMNMTLTLTGNFPNFKNAELIITGSSYYNIYVNFFIKLFRTKFLGKEKEVYV